MGRKKILKFRPRSEFKGSWNGKKSLNSDLGLNLRVDGTEKKSLNSDLGLNLRVGGSEKNP